MRKIETYQDLHKGEAAFVLGSGPSINELSDKTINWIFDLHLTFGSNEFIFFKKKVDYYCIGDALNKQRGYNSNPEAYNRFKPNKEKFYRNPLYNAHYNTVPKDLFDVVYYDCVYNPANVFGDGGVMPVKDCYSISFDMLQLALYMGFKTIYLAGHDCDYNKGTIAVEEVPPAVKLHSLKILNSWMLCEEWMKRYYPDVTVYNVNPVVMQRFTVQKIK